MKRTVPLILVIPILLSLLPGPLPVAAARPGEASLETAADSKGCAVTLLKNRDYFSALCEKLSGDPSGGAGPGRAARCPGHGRSGAG